jgi:hypothetical protein
MASYRKFLHDYHITVSNIDHLEGIEPSVKQKVENLLSYIEIAQDTIQRMSTDRFQILTNEQCMAKNRTAILEIQQRIARHRIEIDELLQTADAA